jgi:hypothetical protein
VVSADIGSPWETAMSQAALALLLALVTAAPPLARQPAEPAVAFACRQRHVPAARACVTRCDLAHGDGEARASCVHACTLRGLHALSDCRRRPPAVPAAPDSPAVASR